MDIETLRRAAVSKGGLLTDELRRKVWPKLLNINVFDLPHKPGKYNGLLTIFALAFGDYQSWKIIK